MLYTTYELLLARTKGEGNSIEPSHEDNPWLIPGKYYSFIYRCKQGNVFTPTLIKKDSANFYPWSNSNDDNLRGAFRITVLAITYNLLSHDAMIDKPYYDYGDSDIPDWRKVTYDDYYIRLLLSDRVDYYDNSHDDDYYYRTDVDFSKWVIKYDINNDTNLYLWADNTYDSAGRPNGKGVIYYMKDECGNEAYFDFKNIKIPHLWYLVDNYYEQLWLKIEYYYLFSRKESDVHELTYRDPIINQKGLLVFTIARNKIKPVYKNITVNGKTIKQLLLPRTHFEVRELITYENLLPKSYIPLLDNIISNKCVGFKLVDCFLSKHTFNYYTKDYNDNVTQQKVNFLKSIDDSISQLDMDVSLFYETFKDEWNLVSHEDGECYLEVTLDFSDTLLQNLENIKLNQNKEFYSNTLFCANPYSLIRSENIDDDIPENIKQLGLINLDDLYTDKS